DRVDLRIDVLAFVGRIRRQRRTGDRPGLPGVVRVIELRVLDAFDSPGQRMPGIGQAEITENVIERSVLQHRDNDSLHARQIFWHPSPLLSQSRSARSAEALSHVREVGLTVKRSSTLPPYPSNRAKPASLSLIKSPAQAPFPESRFTREARDPVWVSHSSKATIK